MGKPTGFLEYVREMAVRRPVHLRINDYLEVYENPDDELLRRQGARCMDCGIPFCHEGCPLGNIIPDFNDLVYRQNWRGALDRLHRTNNFPEFTGRICPAPCESACVLGIDDDPVTIELIEKSVAERGFEEGWITPEPPTSRTGKRVAVIGSGPAGLAAAAQLNRAGHLVTLFEKNDQLGGLLRYGIPDFKLEKWVIDRRVEILRAEGIDFRTGVHVGVTVSATELHSDYDAMVLAGGAEDPRDLALPGRDLDGVQFAMEFLEQQNRRVQGMTDLGKEILATGKNVVVLGGGDTGSDCIGTSHRHGAKEVYNFELLEKPPDGRTIETPWPIHPLPSEILRTSSSHEEGGQRDWGVSTKHFSGTNGKLETLHAVRVRFGDPDPDTGRRKLEEIPGSEFTLNIELVLLALGFLGPVKQGMLESLGVTLDARGNVQTRGYATSIPGIFAAGDMRRGQSLVVWAIAEGRRAAQQADQYLREQT